MEVPQSLRNMDDDMTLFGLQNVAPARPCRSYFARTSRLYRRLIIIRKLFIINTIKWLTIYWRLQGLTRLRRRPAWRHVNSMMV
jgi:hypothetical protein